MSTTVMLTTVDNPFDPFTHYIEWDAWDRAAGYYTNGLLARIAITSDDTSPASQAAAIQAAMEEIVNENVSGVHRLAVASMGVGNEKD